MIFIMAITLVAISGVWSSQLRPCSQSADIFATKYSSVTPTFFIIIALVEAHALPSPVLSTYLLRPIRCELGSSGLIMVSVLGQ